MSLVSVIVPVYHGKKYIKGLIEQVEAAGKLIGHDNTAELIFVNDAPDDPITDKYKSDSIDIIVIDAEYNRGIHGARVCGADKCHGEYVLFLDQDDKIKPEYIQSQMECIGNKDAAVCRCIHEGKIFYNTSFSFERMITKEYMLTEGCPIISTGQVLIRKSSIPKVWKDNIMKTNCADDFLLWLSMAAQNKVFALNQEILFEHVVDYGNTSWDSYRMTISEREMADILIRNKVFTDNDTKMLRQMLANVEKKRLEKLDKFRKMFYILNDWTMLDKKESGIAKYLKSKGLYNIAVYGVGYLGKHLIWELEDSDIYIKYLIDQNADWMREKYRIYKLEDELEEIDAVIVAMAQGEEDIVNKLKEKTCKAVYPIKELVRKAAEEITI